MIWPPAATGDYLRVYVPSGAELLSADGLESSGDRAGGTGRDDLYRRFRLEARRGPIRLSSATGSRSRLPAQPYLLLVRKQAGTAGWPLAVTFGDCHAEAIPGH